ncbi:MAG: 3-phosphoshikimate 1-carboxyvinyltransferase [Candidatus Muiribacteriota bacterium]
MITLKIPADKSISHRAVLLNLCAEGKKAVIKNFLFSEDTLKTVDFAKNIGAKISIDRTRKKLILEKNSLKNPLKEIYCGNSGTTARLAIALLAGAGLRGEFTGDKSLSKRPMKRITEMLNKMNGFVFDNKGKLPVFVAESRLSSIKYFSELGSAQQKTAFLIASLFTSGKSEYVYKYPSRNHTETMLEYMGVKLDIVEPYNEYGGMVTILDKKNFQMKDFTVPGDFSSAAFFIVLGLLGKNKKSLRLKKINLNPTRTGLIETLKKMGADIKIENKKTDFEPYGDIIVNHSKLNGIEVNDKKIIPSMIDEIPILAVACAFAGSESLISGINELKFKESDRLQKICDILDFLGTDYQCGEDFIKIFPQNKSKRTKKNKINTEGDHRIIMSAVIASVLKNRSLKLDNISDINVSFPDFFEKLKESEYEFKYRN